MSDGVRLIVVFLVAVAAPFALFGLWWWVGAWLSIAAVLAGMGVFFVWVIGHLGLGW